MDQNKGKRCDAYGAVDSGQLSDKSGIPKRFIIRPKFFTKKDDMYKQNTYRLILSLRIPTLRRFYFHLRLRRGKY